MRVRGTGAKTILLGSLLTFCSPLIAHHALASSLPGADRGPTSRTASPCRDWPRITPGGVALHGKNAPAGWRHVARGGGISCVPFARSDSGIALAGNAWQWWDHAAGVYARGRCRSRAACSPSGPTRGCGWGMSRWSAGSSTPARSRSTMPIGGGRGCMAASPTTSRWWTCPRPTTGRRCGSGLGRSGDFGSVYPTYGFIYDRPDNGVVVAAAGAPAPQPALNPAPRDLRPVAERPWQTFEEVAQAPALPSAGVGSRDRPARVLRRRWWGRSTASKTQRRYSATVGTNRPDGRSTVASAWSIVRIERRVLPCSAA